MATDSSERLEVGTQQHLPTFASKSGRQAANQPALHEPGPIRDCLCRAQLIWWDNRPLVDGSAQAGLEHRGPDARRSETGVERACALGYGPYGVASRSNSP
jgi:hypothetical protein